MMRAMMLEFPEDPGCDYLDRQYMLGDALLAAPVFSDEGMSATTCLRAHGSTTSPMKLSLAGAGSANGTTSSACRC